MNEQDLAALLIYCGLGAIYGASGYANDVLEGEAKFDPVYFGETVAIGCFAGLIVMAKGGDSEPGEFEAAMVLAIPIVDQLWNASSISRSKHDSLKRP